MDPLEKAVEASWYVRMQNEAVYRERVRCAKIAQGYANNAEYRAAGHTDPEAKRTALDKMEAATAIASAILEMNATTG